MKTLYLIASVCVIWLVGYVSYKFGYVHGEEHASDYFSHHDIGFDAGVRVGKRLVNQPIRLVMRPDDWIYTVVDADSLPEDAP